MKTGSSLKSKSVAELRDIAAELDVVGRHKMSKDALVEAILAARAKAAEREERRAVATSRPLSARPAAGPGRKTAERPKAAAPAKKAASKTAGKPKAPPAKPVKAKTPAKPAAKAPAKAPVKAAAKFADKPKPSPASRVAERPAPKAKKTSAVKTVVKAVKQAMTALKNKIAPARTAKFAVPDPSRKAPVLPKAAPVAKKAPEAAPVKPAQPAPKAAKPAPAPVKPAQPAPKAAKPAPAKEKPAKSAAAPAKTPPVEEIVKPPTVTKRIEGSQGDAVVRPIRRPRVKRVFRTFRLSEPAPPLGMQAEGFLDLPPEALPQQQEEPQAGPAQQPPSPAQPIERDTGGEHIPTIYVDDRVVLLPRDPHWLYCYWDISDGTMNALRNSMDRLSAELVLRVHDVTGVAFNGSNSRSMQDIVLPSQPQGSWYFQAFGEDREHLVEIGVRTSGGRFQPVVRSNTVRTPRSAAAPPVEDTRQDMLTDLAHERALVETEEDFQEESLHPSSPRKPFGPKPAAVPPGLQAEAPAPGEAPTSPMGAFAPSSPFGPLQGPPPIVHPILPPEAKDRDFWLVVDAELIVYGATVPGANLKIQGQPFALRPDGTFSVRFALPDGRQVIPVEASSADGIDYRRITPIVERWTEKDED